MRREDGADAEDTKRRCETRQHNKADAGAGGRGGESWYGSGVAACAVCARRATVVWAARGWSQVCAACAGEPGSDLGGEAVDAGEAVDLSSRVEAKFSTADATITIDRKNRDDNNNSNSCRVGVPIECNQRVRKRSTFLEATGAIHHGRSNDSFSGSGEDSNAVGGVERRGRRAG